MDLPRPSAKLLTASKAQRQVKLFQRIILDLSDSAAYVNGASVSTWPMKRPTQLV